MQSENKRTNIHLNDIMFILLVYSVPSARSTRVATRTLEFYMQFK